MKTKHILYTLSLSSIIILNSCQKVLEFDETDLEPRLVVNCILNSDNSIKVKLTKSKSALDESLFFEVVKDATITLTDGTTIFADFTYVEKKDSIAQYWDYSNTMKFEVYENGYYTHPTARIDKNKTYTITVSAPGFNDVSAETITPSYVQIEQLDTFVTKEVQQYGTQYMLNTRLNFTDVKDEQNFYLLNFEKATFRITIDNFNHAVYPTYYYFTSNISTDDPVFEKDDDGIFSTGGNSYPVFTDRLIDGKNYSISFVIDNIWTDGEFNGFPQRISMGYSEDYAVDIYKINLYSISETYYLYLKTAALQNYSEGDLFSDPVLVYTNITNGMGIFGANIQSCRYLKLSNFPDSLLSPIFPNLETESMFNQIKQEYATPKPGNYF